jgi:ribosomal protein S18 acetylase RimI-like enzyme
MALKVRPAVHDDYDRLLEIYRQVDELHRRQHPEIFQEPDGPPRAFNYYCSVLEDMYSKIFVAEQGTDLVGFIHVVIRDSAPIPIMRPRRYAVIDGIGVREDRQKRGVGTALMEKAHAWASAMGASAVQLSVFAFNQGAVAFYKKQGYQVLSYKMALELPSGSKE